MFSNFMAYLTAGAIAVTSLSSCASTKEQIQVTPPTDAQTIAAYPQFEAEYSDRDSDSSYDEASATKITLSGGSATVDGDGATADGADVKITSGGTYIVSGTLSGGSVTIEAPDTDKVQLVLSGADITSTDGPAIHEVECDKLFLTLVGDNKLTDTANYTLAEGEDEPNAALFTKHDISINGEGSLTVSGNYMHGIASKDDLKITGGTVNVTSVDDGIRGRDSVFVRDGIVNITAGGDGIQSNNDSAEDKGRISIDGGTLNITAAHDGIQAESVLQINGGEININSGDINAEVQTEGFGGMGGGMPMGGNPRGGMRPEGDTAMTPPPRPEGDTAMTPPDEGNMPRRGMGGGPRSGMRPEGDTGMAPPENGRGGMRPGGDVVTAPPEENTDSLQTTDETVSDSKKAIKSANTIYINGGTVNAASEDDAIHADAAVTIEDGKLALSSADDAIHAEYTCAINGGNINISKSYEGIEGKTVIISGGDISITSADDAINASDPATSGARPGRGNDEVYIEITGGTINAVSGFDTLDSNGNIFIRGGSITLDGPSNGMDCAIDCDGRAYVYGGTVAASGISGGSTTFDSSSGQPSIAVIFTSQKAAGTQVSLCDESGKVIAQINPTRSFRGVIFSDESLREGKSYIVKAGDTSVSAELGSMSVAVNENGSAVSGGMGGGMPGGGMGGGPRGGRGGMRPGENTAPENTQ